MGNCIGAAFSQNEADKKMKFWTVDEKSSSRAPLSKLGKGQLPLYKMEEIDCLIPKLHGSCSLEARADMADGFNVVERVKIVVNKKQWRRLMGSKEEIRLRRMVLQSSVRRAKKWRPSLAVIPEL